MSQTEPVINTPSSLNKCAFVLQQMEDAHLQAFRNELT